MMRQGWRSRRGSTMVELGLVLGAFLFMMIGTLDIGRVMYMHQTLTERARKSVRWGASRTFNETNVKNVVLYDSATPADGARPVFGLTASNVIVTRDIGASGVPDVLTIKVTGWSYRFMSPYIAGSVIAPDIITSMTMENP
jgi:Flp pilus assembly protein TadG